ncbi:hypothetical protein A2673_03270 [Candidatus Kaiserbacteria bacterium RIFCSPHIGHO2_01_FULL_50_13]|uniref:Nudix hydrolase domain-containing protein n=1 Tax=Candidatus Kaiserbacteria bacterium RIFCSPLOWO2_01_FULL_50_24 TaxID=1798507 RepID=A0A1F6EIP4_9BACT|nr:MAG: hypothetical protein A2673_03270 [Candidatus Kaiserbacteria bacterium RIFCSPHIGHO2_01_FULL_50_13]OGG73525.1 MAG: hypothetical protein A3A34_01110 [Candidatus Kaiserbacteria bacterium RIFCSPLOWO2_01_FULL_50_24]OGG81573.1 MAG: hypothetical protein A3H74_00645 [Candidatus Kaiserbacteria bacterium RIFCSPLOWO2_02_FULL_51_13]
MEILRTIKDVDFGLETPEPKSYKERQAARAIVFDNDKNIALLHATKVFYHKLPGGGVEEGEDVIDALKRECLEEIGCGITNIRELGIVEEYRNKFEIHQLSYNYIADLNGEKCEPNFVEDEIADGFEPVWMPLGDAIKVLESESNVKDYQGKFIQMRDLLLLNEVKKLFQYFTCPSVAFPPEADPPWAEAKEGKIT